MSKHTPGPWYAEIDEPLRDHSLAVTTGEGATGDWIASARPILNNETSAYDGPLQEANARLIAAAPDLYEALAVLHTLLDFDDEVVAGVAIVTENPDRINHAFKVARAALRKARGEA